MTEVILKVMQVENLPSVVINNVDRRLFLYYMISFSAVMASPAAAWARPLALWNARGHTKSSEFWRYGGLDIDGKLFKSVVY